MKTLALKNILVPVDFSSIEAIEAAKKLADRFSTRIHLLHVQEAMYSAGFIATTPMAMAEMVSFQQDNEKRLRLRLRDLAARLDLSPATCYVLTESPAFDAICRTAKELCIDLVAMPTDGRTGLKHVFLDSKAERVVQHSPCPIFIARRRTNGVNKILVPVDFFRCSLDALNYAIQFAKLIESPED